MQESPQAVQHKVKTDDASPLQTCHWLSFQKNNFSPFYSGSALLCNALHFDKWSVLYRVSAELTLIAIQWIPTKHKGDSGNQRMKENDNY